MNWRVSGKRFLKFLISNHFISNMRVIIIMVIIPT